MLVYISNWAKTDKEPESIVECDPWVDYEDNSLVLHLKRKTTSGGFQHMSVKLDELQVREIIRQGDEAGMGIYKE